MKQSWIGLSLVFGLVFLPFPSSYGETGVTDSEVVVGGHTTESGALAAFAVTAQTETAYYNEVNEKGGVNGRKIKWIRRDSQSLAPKSVEVTRQLVESDKVLATVGCNGASHVAVVKYLNDQGVPDLYFSDGSGAYLDPALKTAFPLYYPWESEGKAGAEYVAKHYPGKKVCFLQTKDSLGEEYGKGAKDAFTAWNSKAKESKKIVIGPTLGIERLASQADSEILNFKQEKCDVVMTSAYGNLPPNAINYGASQGYKPKWIVQTWNVTAKFISLLNEEARDGIISAANLAREKSLADPKAWEAFEALLKKNNIPVSGSSVTGYVIAEVFTETLKRAGKNLTRQSLVKAAESFKNWKCSLCLNRLNSSKTNHWAFGPAKLVVIKDKQWQLLR